MTFAFFRYMGLFFFYEKTQTFTKFILRQTHNVAYVIRTAGVRLN